MISHFHIRQILALLGCLTCYVCGNASSKEEDKNEKGQKAYSICQICGDTLVKGCPRCGASISGEKCERCGKGVSDICPQCAPQAYNLFQNAEKAFYGQRYAEAADRYKEAATLGLADAQYRYGRCLKEGKGRETNVQEACDWLKKAADQGIAEAKLELGECKENGTGKPRSLPCCEAFFDRGEAAP